MIRVSVIASSPVVRAGLDALLGEDSRFTVVRSPGAGPVPTRLRDTAPDVLLMEIASAEKLVTLRGSNVVDAPPIVLMADRLGRGELRRALHSGVRAVLSRDASAAEIVAAIEGVAAGLTVLSSEDMDVLVPEAALDLVAVDSAPGEALTSRESEVLTFMAEGLANKEIAGRLNISEHTVKFHVSSILAKLGASSRGEAVARGIRGGMIVI